MSAALERQVRPIYDAIESGSNKSAVVACNKLLKKNPHNDLIKALKSLALVRLHKVEECLVLCDEVFASKPTDDDTLSVMTHVLRGLGRQKDVVTMFENAYKKQPANEELGAQTFLANVRTENWKSAQQVATKLYKHFQEPRYLYWGVVSAVLQANEPTTPENMRNVLYKLAHRQLTSANAPSLTADRLYLHLEVFRELGLIQEAATLVESEVGKNICATSLSCDELRRKIWRTGGMLKEEGEQSERLIVEKHHRGWLEFISVIDATFFSVSSDKCVESDVDRQEQLDRISRTRDLFTRIAELDGKKDRTAFLAILELERRARVHGLSHEPQLLVDVLEGYFKRFGDKTCCFEDIKPYLSLDDSEMPRWVQFLTSVTPSPISSPADLQVFINVQKLSRHKLQHSEIDGNLESARAASYAKEYFRGLQFGMGLPATELQPADDLIILASNVLVNLWHLSNNEAALYTAAALLEYAVRKSEHSFRIKLLLIRIYRLLGASSLSLDHYRSMNVKQVQYDTLSHYILARASTFSLGDLTYTDECSESNHIYESNSLETFDFIVRAFTTEKYSQIADFINFEDRLDNSLQRDLAKIEQVRMRLAHEPINTETIDMELIELKFSFDRYHHDNRDFDVIPNYQPECQPSLNAQTLLFNKDTGMNWMWAFLKIYIRAFQQASDMNDDVEEKLLVGDRPKYRRDPLRLHRKERLTFTQDDFKDLTPEEQNFLDFTVALADWLEPYHDHLRPSTAAVLAEAAKLSELKFGHPLKGMDIPPPAPGTNGQGKKDEEAPPVKEPPLSVLRFFDDMLAQLKTARKAGTGVLVLHIASLTQEALLLLVVQSLRFKPQPVAKIHKLGALQQSCKDVRAKALNVLRSMAVELSEIAAAEVTPESRKMIETACESLSVAELDHDFVVDFAKRITEARKKLLEGFERGILRICSAHS